MPFVNFHDSPEPNETPSVLDPRHLFIGRASEMHYFAELILRPEKPTHNIISIAGNAGVGKTSLLKRFIHETQCSDYSGYCEVALVDERQATPMHIMQHWAEQLGMEGGFSRALREHHQTFWRLFGQGDGDRDNILRRAPDIAGSIVENVPIAGPLTQVTADFIVKQMENRRQQQDLHQALDSIHRLTQAFTTELWHHAATPAMLLEPRRMKRRKRILLCIDTFEQISDQILPWLLDLLEMNIQDNVVFVIAGRLPLNRLVTRDLTRWQEHISSDTLRTINLNSFDREETEIYLTARGITDPARIETIRALSRGLPLYLGLLTSNTAGQIYPTANVIENYLRWIPREEETKREIAQDAALLTRPFNQDDLAIFPYIPDQERHSLYHWLVEQPFVESHDLNGRYSYHDHSQELFSRYLFQRSPTRYYETRRLIADHYHQQIQARRQEDPENIYKTEEWRDLTLALAEQLLLLPDQTSHNQGIGQVLRIFRQPDQAGEILSRLKALAGSWITEDKESSADLPHLTVNRDAREAAQLLIRYIEALPASPEFLEASSLLIKRLSAEKNFSQKQLSQLYHDRGGSYSAMGRYIEAITDFDKAIELRPRHAWTHGSRGIAYTQIHEYDRAIDDFNQAIAIKPDYAWAYGSRGLAYRDMQNYAQALADFSKAMELNPHNAWPYVQRGEIYQLLNQQTQALTDFNRAIEMIPDYGIAYMARGKLYQYQHRNHQALLDFNQAIDLGKSDAYVYRSQIYAQMEKNREALADLSQALENGSRPDWVFGERGQLLLRQGDYLAAIESLSDALEMADGLDEQAQERDAILYRQRGMAYASMGDYTRAIADYEQTIGLKPDDSDTWYLLGNYHLRQGDPERAAEAYSRCWDLEPGHVNAGWMAQWTDLSAHGPSQEILANLESLSKHAPDTYEGHLCQSVARWFQEHYAEAEKETQMLIEFQPDEPDAYFWKAMACLWTGKDTEAMISLQQAQDLGLSRALFQPLQWIEADQPELYSKFLAHYLEE